MRISEWLKEDPISFDLVRREKCLKVNTEVFKILISKLRASHNDYFINALGLNARIKFNGYNKPVQASVPYKDKPVEFYKWWYSNQNLINMTFAEKIVLFDKVYQTKPSELNKEHKQLIKKK